MKKLLLLVIVAFFLLVVGAGYGIWKGFLANPGSMPEQEIVYEVMPGKTFSAVAKDLEQKGIVSNAALFSFFARVTGEASKMKVGEYLFKTSMRPTEVMGVLISGKSIGRNFTISEGLNIYEVADLIEPLGIGTREQFLKDVQDPVFIQSLLGESPTSLEGYLFPETYQVTKFTEMRVLIKSMVQKFMAVYTPLIPLAKAKGWTRQQVVTLASIVEKETGAPEERPLISSVFHNRLQKGMMLQTDPTILYAKMRKSGHFEIKIGSAGLALEDDYNTYKHKGLPPGPIANPGAESLRAALSPAQSEYLFFVSQNNGTHIFSKDYAAHQKAVAKFQQDPKMREGKSWRDLKREREKKSVPDPSLVH